MVRTPLLALLLALALPGAASAGKAFDASTTSGNQLMDYLDHGAWDFRYDAAREIEHRCIREADAKLAALVEEDPNTKVRLASLTALTTCRMDSTLVAAETMSLVDSELAHRKKAIAIIEKLGNERSGPVLAQVLRGDPDEAVQLKAAVVLRKRAWRGAEPVQKELAFSAGTGALRVECVRGLVVVDAKHRPLFHKLLRSDPEDKVRLSLVRILEEAPRPEDKDVLIEMLDDGYSKVQRHAARALGNLGDRSVAPILRDKALAVTDRKVAEEFAEVATRLGG
ncbi:MAG: HEAT repeat domain-containing protein [Deltaproteobacteria bacterium]|nr:HEAT repeat domain-containing protein [Deltaproteobacteria bacterium]